MQRDTLCRLVCGWLAWPMLNQTGHVSLTTRDGCRLLTARDELRYVSRQDAADVVADAEGYHWRVPRGWIVPIDLEAKAQSVANIPEGVDRHTATA